MNIKKIVLAALIVICSLGVVHAFFLPWAKASTSTTKVAKSLVDSATVGALANSPFAGKFIRNVTDVTNDVASLGDIEIKTAVSGYDIPTLINKNTSKVAISLLSAILKDTKDLDKKSLLVYILPLLALVCIGLAAAGLRFNIALIVMAIMSGAIAIGGLYNLATMNLTSTVIKISIEQGLWQTMYGFLFISILSVIWIVFNMLEPKR